jgi:hypothetical protein
MPRLGRAAEQRPAPRGASRFRAHRVGGLLAFVHLAQTLTVPMAGCTAATG